MRIVNDSIKERSEITSLTLLDDHRVAYTTKYNGTKIIDAKSHTTLSKIIHKELANSTAICFSPDATLLAFANDNVINILNLDTKKIIKSIKIATKSIDILIFHSNYIIAGTNQGRVLQYRYDNSALLARVCSFPYIHNDITQKSKKYVSAFAILGSQLACSGQGGAIFVIDIYSQTNRKILLKKGKRVDVLTFIDENTLVSADISGKISIFDLKTDEKPKTIDAPFVNVKQIVKMPNPNFIAISAEDNYIAIADINKTKIIHAKYIEFSSNVTRVIATHENSLLITLANSTIVYVNLAICNDLRDLIVDNSLQEAYELIEDEPMLMECREYKLLEKRYNIVYHNTLNALINQNKTLALKNIYIVKDVRSKRYDIDDLFTAFKHYNRLKVLYIEKKYALAFALCDKYIPLKQTPIFIKLEEAWKDSFVNAQRHIFLGKDENAKALLNKYNTVVSKRPIIKLFMNKDEDFMKFLTALENKDFLTVEELASKNMQFTSVPIYVSMNKSIQRTVNKIDTLIKKGELKKSKEMLSQFRSSSHINNTLRKLYLRLDEMTELTKAYNKNDFKSCYEILDTHEQLNSSELGILLNNHWVKLIHECENYALKANPKAIKDKLERLILVKTRRSRIGDLLRVSFHSKIKAYLAKSSFRGSENIIYSYIDIFGSDNEIKSLMKMHEIMSKRRLAITQKDERVQRDKWIDVEDIVK